MFAAPGSFVALLPSGEVSALHELGQAREFPRGSVLMYEGESGEWVMVLLAGRVKVTRSGQTGQEVLLSIRDPGDLLGELAVIDGRPRIATVTGLEQVHALVIPAPEFRAHLERAPAAAFALREVLTTRCRDAVLKRYELVTSDTAARVAARLVELTERYGKPAEGGIEITLPLSQEELSAWTGSSRAGTAKALQTLRALGYIETRRRRLVVTDVEALRRRAA
jgi:CRP-like cAMP-binding protein